MKKVLTLAVIATCTLLISSCKKGYTCLCSDENGDTVQQVDMEQTMEAECAANIEQENIYSCKLVRKSSLPNRP